MKPGLYSSLFTQPFFSLPSPFSNRSPCGTQLIFEDTDAFLHLLPLFLLLLLSGHLLLLPPPLGGRNRKRTPSSSASNKRKKRRRIKSGSSHLLLLWLLILLLFDEAAVWLPKNNVWQGHKISFWPIRFNHSYVNLAEPFPLPSLVKKGPSIAGMRSITDLYVGRSCIISYSLTFSCYLDYIVLFRKF